jgi:D-alanyl-D-alanine dipeptidase
MFVEYNTPAQGNRGSCIFLHIWKNRRSATTGCTAMAENDLKKIMHRLDPDQRPMLVQLTLPIYNEVREKWDLPQLR